ncbi:hypothetical protein EHZ86_00385 [Aeromonas australiensis]|uniref:hypothetical protein n=1 Tax=Aeromonas australiensis TaxID=1114880 RepID=UPI001F307B1F|nr:hypothetical protein [Aeromonas australiensis]MCF3095812.1 hypothetical protein [Aeromonas australiensis]
MQANGQLIQTPLRRGFFSLFTAFNHPLAARHQRLISYQVQTSAVYLSLFATKNSIFHKRFTMSHGIMLTMNCCLDS